MALSVYVRRIHRPLGLLWLLSLALPIVVDTSEIPGPSIPAILFIATILTGGYLLIRPWVRDSTSMSERLNGLTDWSRPRAAIIRKSHRIAGTLFLISLVVGLGITAAFGSESQAIFIPVVVVLLYLAITGLFMFFRPWVNRARSA